MKTLILLIILSISAVFAKESTQEEQLKKEHLQKQLERENKYAKEQRFYSKKEYDLKSHEVNMESVKNLPDVEDTNEDFDMDDVYD